MIDFKNIIIIYKRRAELKNKSNYIALEKLLY